MDINTITEFIGNLGFPIVMCIAMFWKIDAQDKQHATEMENLRKSLENNTTALNALITKLEN